MPRLEGYLRKKSPMAKASFHKNQRVYVKPVGTWALIEKIDASGFLGVRNAAPVVAERLGISRAALYKYLREIRSRAE